MASLIGAVAGAALAGDRGPRAAATGALAGAAGLAAAEAVARARQRPGEIPALWSRIITSGALAAPAGWAAGRLTGAGPVPVATVAGAIAGALGLRPQKVLLGPAAGAAIGLGLAGLSRSGQGGGDGRVPGSVAAAAAVTGFRVLSAVLFRDPQLSLLAERVHPADVPFVVPLASQTRYVGTEYVRSLAEVMGGKYTPDVEDIGIVASLDLRPGPPSTRPGPTRRSASSTSTPPGSPWTSCRSGGYGCGPATCSTGPWWPIRSGRPACR